MHRLHSYGADLPAHTWRRNTNAVALSCACMGGRPDPWSIPPAKPQLEALCQEAAAVARSWGWSADQISVQRVMTHAEAAANRDGRVMHDNYGPVIWGGTGGEQLRERVRQLLSVEAASGPAPLQFRRTDSMEARGLPLATEIDANGSSWALATALLERYELPFQWDASNRRILVGALDVVPRFQDDAVQASVGWPLFEMTLERSTAPVILGASCARTAPGAGCWNLPRSLASARPTTPSACLSGGVVENRPGRGAASPP